MTKNKICRGVYVRLILRYKVSDVIMRKGSLLGYLAKIYYRLQLFCY